MARLVVPLAIAVSVGSVAVATDAFGYTTRNWNSQSVPLKDVQNGNLLGEGYGTWRLADTSGGTSSIGDGYLRKPSPGGDEIYFNVGTYINAGVCLQPTYTKCDQQFYAYRNANSGKSNDNRWYHTSGSTGVDPNGDVARGVLKVCEDVRYHADPCSGQADTFGDPY